VNLVSVNEGAADALPGSELMDFVEQVGGYFESSGLTRMGGTDVGLAAGV